MALLARMGIDVPGFAALDDTQSLIVTAGLVIAAFLATIFVWQFFSASSKNSSNGVFAVMRFVWSCMFKPIKNGASQQDALESFYRAQAHVYDSTRTRLLRGREDMLGLVAAQIKHKTRNSKSGRVWVDIGGGTGYNIEAMGAFVDVPTFFSKVYLVDLSPSLCEVARQRFARLGWKNVEVICEDARAFRLESNKIVQSPLLTPRGYFEQESPRGGADLITLSYSLSMIPDFYSVVDSLTNLLAPHGVVGVTDFYVQNRTELAGRNYTGGIFNRHVNWLGRVFWRTWFEFDRVGLEPGRRDYLEYRFGTVLSVDNRNYLLGGIPFYIWVGCHKLPTASVNGNGEHHSEVIERLDAAATESPYLSPVHHKAELSRAVTESAKEIRSKAFNAAILNLSSNLPLPSFFYQNHHWRIHYDDQLKKHTQFGTEYIYAFTWEDPRVDQRLLNIGSDDVVLAITSAGDNILAYALEQPKRIHAVDLNPNQNHLLELKVASFSALGHGDLWKIFGEGKHADFRELLITKLSPHMSSRALQYWLDHVSVFTSKNGRGLYETGGSRHSIKIVRWLFGTLGLSGEIKKLCEAKTLNEQREIWHGSVRKIILSRLLSWVVIGNEKFLWKALGVPKQQRDMIFTDYAEYNGVKEDPSSLKDSRAIWEYVVNTLDPVIDHSLLCDDNYFYLLSLQGKYSPRCLPDYLTPQAHSILSRPGAFDGLRIHTDEIKEVLARITPGTLTIAVIMDSMDWFDPGCEEATTQILALNRALAPGGRVMLRSAGLRPWYVRVFGRNGFSIKRVGARLNGECIDRVNMYASTWICTKTTDQYALVRTMSEDSGFVDKLEL